MSIIAWLLVVISLFSITLRTRCCFPRLVDFRYSNHAKGMRPGSAIDGSRDSIIVVRQSAIEIWPAANPGNVSRYSSCRYAVTRVHSVSISRETNVSRGQGFSLLRFNKRIIEEYLTIPESIVLPLFPQR